MAIQADPPTADALPPADDTELSVVAPAYNEAGNIGPLVEELVAVLDDEPAWQPYEIVLVDDGSTDGTGRQIREAAALFEQVRGLELNGNHGQSAALSAGFEAARGTAIVPIDADLQNDPADIPRLLAELEAGADCVSGWRRERSDPLRKTVPSRIQTELAKLTGPDIHDFGCSLTAYRASALRDVSLRGEQHRYIPAQLHAAGHDIREVEVNHRERRSGASKYGVGRLLRGFSDLLFHLFASRFRARPMHIFGGGGLLVTLLGLTIGGWLVAQRYLAGLVLGDALPRLLLAVALTLFGVGMVGFGILTELLVELLYRDERPYRIAEVHE